MIDKINNITAGNTQNRKATESNKQNASSSAKTAPKVSDDGNNASNVEISSELDVNSMSNEAPINTAKVSAIKSAIARGDYPIDIQKVADALMQAYKDIK